MVAPCQSEAIDRIFTALADPLRRNAFEVLTRGAQSSGDLAREMGVSAATMSKHLRILREADLVTQTHPEYDSRVRIYALGDAPLRELRSWLARTEKGWSDQLAAFARHIEQTRE